MTPAATLATLRSHPGPVIVDFDETLYLRNSTEDFLGSARPALPAKLVLQTLDTLKPWRWRGGDATRDIWRIVFISLFFPWTWLFWRLKAARLANQSTNTELADLLRKRADVTVASIGFRRIIEPLLQAMNMHAQTGFIACRILPARDRIAGKRALVANALGEKGLRSAIVVTDSPDDHALLSAGARGCLTRWPQAVWRGALEHVYLPFSYLSQVKRPGSRYLWRSIIQEDYVFWVLASLAGVTAIAPHLLGVALLSLSFWAVYETGYVDNDRTGVRFEEQPKLSPGYDSHRIPTPPLEPWIWAALSGYVGLSLLSATPMPSPVLMMTWAGVLLATIACFRVFNRIDKRSRVWLFGLLQLARTAAIAAVASVSLIGAAGLAAHVVAQWVPYIFYRWGQGQDWHELPVSSIRLYFFIMFSVLAFIAADAGEIHWGIAVAFLAWNLVRARKELRELVTQAHRIDTQNVEGASQPIAHK